MASVRVIRSLVLLCSLLCACRAISGPVAAPAASPVPVVLPAQGVPAQVVGVTDGDTITAIVDGRQIKVRLNGIDAPEKKQAFGNVSKQALSDLVFGQRVSIVPLGKDRWGAGDCGGVHR
jgi:endonuclease YncB( thermonuclease family)